MADIYPIFLWMVPECTITSPIEGDVFEEPADITVDVDASTPIGVVTLVEFYIDSGSGLVKVGEDTTAPYSYTIGSVLVGNYSLVARVTNSFGAIVYSDPVNIEVQNVVPTCEIYLPEIQIPPIQFTVGSKILVRANATDTAGYIVKVEFYVDGEKAYSDTISPYSFVLDSDSLTLGEHVLTAIATDDKGGVSIPQFPVTIDIVPQPLISKDTIPPITTSNISFCPNWNRQHTAIVELTAVDYANTEHDTPSGVDKTYYTIDGTIPDFSSSYGPTDPGNVTKFVVTGQGAIPIKFFSTDNNGNIEQVKTDFLRLDDVAPVTVCTADPEPDGSNGWYITNPEITLTATDSSSGVYKTYYKLNSGAFIEYSGPFYLPGEGIYTLQFFSEDIAGNIERIKTTFFKYDAQAPLTKDDITTGLHTGPTTIRFFTSDLFSGVEKTYYTLDGTDPTIDSTFGSSVIISESGYYTVKYFSVDFAGNIEAIKTNYIDVFVDDDIPSVYIFESFLIDGINGWYKNSPDISIFAVDSSGIKEILYKLYANNQTTTAKYTSTINISSTIDLSENHFIRLGIDQSFDNLEIDIAGVLPSITTITEIINAINAIAGDSVATETGPDGLAGSGYITVTSPTAGTGSSTSEIKFLPVALDATQEVFGLDESSYPHTFTETILFVSYISPFILPSDNYWNIDYYAIDNEENESEIASKSYKLDSEAPETNITNSFEPDGDNGWYITNPVITLEAEDNLSGVDKIYYRWDEGCWNEYSVGTVINIPSQGTHNLEVYSTDLAGNEEIHQNIVYKYDNSVPETTDNTIDYQGVIFTARGSGFKDVIGENPEITGPYNLRLSNYNVVSVYDIFNVTTNQTYILEEISGVYKNEISIIPIVKNENSTRLDNFRIQLIGLEDSNLNDLSDVLRIFNKTNGLSYYVDYNNSTLDGNLVIKGYKPINLGDVLEVDYKINGAPISPDDIIDINYAYDISHDPQVLNTLNYSLLDPLRFYNAFGDNIVVSADQLPGSNTIEISGFTIEAGIIISGTKFVIEGDTTVYTIVKNINIENFVAILEFTPLLYDQATIDDKITFNPAYSIDYDATIYLTPTDLYSSIVHTYYTLDGSDPTQDSTEGTIIELSDPGMYIIKYFSIDEAGNIEPIKTAHYVINIDKRAPDLELDFVPNLLEDGENGWFKYSFGLNIQLWSEDKRDLKDEDVVASTLHKIVTGYNDTVDFDEGSGELTATLSQGLYTSLELANELQNALKSAGTYNYVVSLLDNTSSEGQRFEIRTNPAFVFDLLFSSGSNSSKTIAKTIGFGSNNSLYPVVDQVGQSSYISLYYKFKLNNYFAQSVQQIRTSILGKKFECIEIIQGASGFFDEILIDGLDTLPSEINVEQRLYLFESSDYLYNVPIVGTLEIKKNAITQVEGIDYIYEVDTNKITMLVLPVLETDVIIAYYSLKDRVLVDYIHYIGLDKVNLGLNSSSLTTEVQIYGELDKFVDLSNNRSNFIVTFPSVPDQFFTKDGEWTIYVKAYDRNSIIGTGAVQKESDLKQYPFKLDRVSPVTTDNVPGFSWLKAPIDIDLIPYDEEPGSGISKTHYTVDGSTPTRLSSFGTSINLTNSGIYTIKYFSVDNAGNSEIVKAGLNQVRVDSDSPYTTATILPNVPDGDNWWYITQPEITLFAIDSDSGVFKTFYRINDDLVFTEYTTPFLLPVEGFVTITYYSIDNVGNIEDQKILAIKYDSVQPETTTDAPETGYTSKSRINFIVIDESSGVYRTYYTTDGSDPDETSDYGSYVDFTVSGTYILKFFSVDNAGNVESIKDQTINIDLEAPEVTDFTPAGCIITEETTEITFIVSDILSGVDIDSIIVDVDGVVYSTSKNSSYFSYTGTSEEYVITITPISGVLNFQDVEFLRIKNVRDFAGNISDVLEFNLVAPDIIAPCVREVYPSPNVQDVSTNTNVIAFIDDNQSGVNIKSVVVSINDVDFKINFKNILSIQYTGVATSAVLQINNKSLFTYINSVRDISISFYDANYNTIKKLEQYFNSLSDYTATIIDNSYEQTESTLVLNVSNLNILQPGIIDLYLPEENLNFSFLERGFGYLVFASPSFSFEHKIPVNVKINAYDNSNNVMDEFSYIFIPHIYAAYSVKKRNHLNRIALEYLDDIKENIASNYSRSQSTNFYGHQKAICLELGRHFEEIEHLSEDKHYDTLRPQYLYQKLGYLLNTEPMVGLSQSDYRLLLKSLISILFKGSLKSSLEQGASLFIGSDVKIVEVVFSEGSDISDQFIFTVDLIPSESYTGVDLLVLSSNLTHIFDLVKPAHVFIIQRFVWTDEFNFQAGCLLLWELDQFGNYVIDQFGNRVPQIAFDGYQAAETQSETAICDRFKYRFDNVYEEDVREDCSESLSKIEEYTDDVSAQFLGTQTVFQVYRVPMLKDSTHVATIVDVVVKVNGVEVAVVDVDPLTGKVTLSAAPAFGDLVTVTYKYNEFFIYRVITFYLNSPDSVFGGGSEYFNIESLEDDEFIIDDPDDSGMLIEKEVSLITKDVVGRIEIPPVLMHAHVCDYTIRSTIQLSFTENPYIGKPYPDSIEEDSTITDPDFPGSFYRIADFKEVFILNDFTKKFSPESGKPDEIYFSYLNDTRYRLNNVSIMNKLCKEHDTYVATLI